MVFAGWNTGIEMAGAGYVIFWLIPLRIVFAFDEGYPARGYLEDETTLAGYSH
jgi:hypothetical protein